MLNVKNTYFGFTNNKKPLQAGKIEKSLDMLFRYDGVIMTAKENVYIRLKEGYKPEIEENHSYYSRRIDDYTKPKTLYKLQKDNSYYEINKTLYEFATFLIENNFLNEEVATAFIDNETKEKADQERMDQERIKKEREEREKQRQKEEEERKRIVNEKRSRWAEKGNEFMNDKVAQLIQDTVDHHWNKYGIDAGEDRKKEFTGEVLERMPEKLGNQAFVINSLQRHNEEGKLGYFHIMDIEVEILMSVFNVHVEDGNRTITAKVKAAFEGREYKGSRAS